MTKAIIQKRKRQLVSSTTRTNLVPCKEIIKGDIVYVKMRGYSIWPAIITEINEPKTKIAIRFFGDNYKSTKVRYSHLITKLMSVNTHTLKGTQKPLERRLFCWKIKIRRRRRRQSLLHHPRRLLVACRHAAQSSKQQLHLHQLPFRFMVAHRHAAQSLKWHLHHQPLCLSRWMCAFLMIKLSLKEVVEFVAVAKFNLNAMARSNFDH